MDRKGIIGVAIAIIVLVWWQIDYSRKMQRYADAQRAEAAAAAAAQENAAPKEGVSPAPTSEASAPPTASVPSAPAAAPATQALEEEKTEKIQSPALDPLVDYLFTTHGGGIRRAVLLKHVAETGKVKGDETKVILNQIGPLPIGAITEKPGEESPVPFALSVDSQAGVVTAQRTDSRQLETVKKFIVPKGSGLAEEYSVQMEVTFTNRGAQPLQVPGYFVHTGAAAPIHKNDQPYYTGFSYLHEGKNTFRQLGSFAGGGVLGFGKTPQPVYTETTNDVSWVGVANQYFATILAPVDARGGAVWAHKFHVENAPLLGAPENKAPVDAVEGAIGMPAFTLNAGQSATQMPAS